MNGWIVAHGGRMFPETFRATRTAAVEAFLDTARAGGSWDALQAAGFCVVKVRLVEGWE